jgi:hypothetical protein
MMLILLHGNESHCARPIVQFSGKHHAWHKCSRIAHRVGAMGEEHRDLRRSLHSTRRGGPRLPYIEQFAIRVPAAERRNRGGVGWLASEHGDVLRHCGSRRHIYAVLHSGTWPVSLTQVLAANYGPVRSQDGTPCPLAHVQKRLHLCELRERP